MRVPLHVRMIAGLLVGAGAGLVAHATMGGSPGLDAFVRNVTQPVGQVFVRLLFMLVLPLVFSALALGVAGLGDLRRVGRLGARTLAYTVALSTIAVAIGVTTVSVLRPGEGMTEEQRARLWSVAAERADSVGSAATAPKTGIELVVQVVPDNVVRAAAQNDVLAVIFFAVAIGVGLMLTRTPAAERFAEALQGLLDVSMTLIQLVILVAPIGVAALLFSMTAQLGIELFALLARYVGTVLLALAIHQFVVYSLAVRLLGGMSPVRFFRDVADAMLMAFSTASSAATLPTALRVAEERLQLPTHVSRFVLTIGSTLNQNGTALFEGVTVLFLAQLHGVQLDLAQQVLVVLTCILGGIGTAGVPAASLPVVALILGMIGVPVEGIALVIGVDRLLDMSRTTLNVTGDLAAAVVLSRGEVREAPAGPA